MRLSGLNWPNVILIMVEIPNRDSLISLTGLVSSMEEASNVRVFYFSSLRLNQVIFLMLFLLTIISDRLTVVTVDLIGITDLIITSRSNSPTSLRYKST